MEFIEQYRPYVEFLYLLSGPLMFVGVIVAIIQLYTHRKETKVIFERETISSSLNILDTKLKGIYSACEELEKLESYQHIPVFEGEVRGLDKTKVTCTNDCLIKFYHEDYFDHLCGVTVILNELETLSQYILSGILNEELCYKLEGNHFLQYIEDYKPFIACERNSEEDPFCENLVKLYDLWSSKAAHDKAIRIHQRSLQEINKSKRPQPLKTIGE